MPLPKPHEIEFWKNTLFFKSWKNLLVFNYNKSYIKLKFKRYFLLVICGNTSIYVKCQLGEFEEWGGPCPPPPGT